MLGYIEQVQQGFIREYGFRENPEKSGIPESVPDGEYPMIIDGKLDFVRVISGKIHCCNYDGPTVGKLRQQSALCDSDRPVMVKVEDEELLKLLGGQTISVIRVYPDMTHPGGHFRSTFKVEIALTSNVAKN